MQLLRSTFDQRRRRGERRGEREREREREREAVEG